MESPQRRLARWWTERVRKPQGLLDLIPLGVALVQAVVIATLGVGGLVALILLILGFPQLEPTHTVSLAGLFDILKLALAGIAGVGALVALVVAYRRQLVTEATSRLEHAKEDRELTRVFNDRFATAAAQIGSGEPAIRLAGVYAMAALADDWLEQRQTCVNVLCGFLRMPYEPDPGTDGPVSERVAFARNREVRHAVIGVIRERLMPQSGRVLWHDCHFDFRGAVFDGGAFAHIEVPAGCGLNFLDARFVAGFTQFQGMRCTGGVVNFWRTDFAGGEVTFWGCSFIDGDVGFGECNFGSGKIDFSSIDTSDGYLGTTFGSDVSFRGSRFTGAEVLFNEAVFSTGRVDFDRAEFTGGKVDFADVRITGGELDFSGASDWSTPPVNLQPDVIGLKLPELAAGTEH